MQCVWKKYNYHSFTVAAAAAAATVAATTVATPVIAAAAAVHLNIDVKP